MKFEISNKTKINIYKLTNDLGYFYQKKQDKKIYFVRPPKGFPRFHLCLEIEKDKLIFTLHLDQKAPIYEGAVAHAAEHEGRIVEAEVERIKKLLKKFLF